MKGGRRSRGRVASRGPGFTGEMMYSRVAGAVDPYRGGFKWDVEAGGLAVLHDATRIELLPGTRVRRLLPWPHAQGRGLPPEVSADRAGGIGARCHPDADITRLRESTGTGVRVWDPASGRPVGQPLTERIDRVPTVACAVLDGRPAGRCEPLGRPCRSDPEPDHHPARHPAPHRPRPSGAGNGAHRPGRSARRGHGLRRPLRTALGPRRHEAVETVHHQPMAAVRPPTASGAVREVRVCRASVPESPGALPRTPAGGDSGPTGDRAHPARCAVIADRAARVPVGQTRPSGVER